jgi:CHAT domain-containing protein
LQQEFQAKLAQPDYYSQYWQLQQNPKAAADFPNEVMGLTSLPFWNQEYGNISSNFWAIRTFLDQASHLTEPQPNSRHRISTTIFLLKLRQ